MYREERERKEKRKKWARRSNFIKGGRKRTDDVEGKKLRKMGSIVKDE